MNKKTLQRLLCFCLALCFCFSIAIEPIQAHAVALELGYMTWILISVMTAMGFTFAATGGIQALQNAVEEAVDEFDEYQKTIGHNRGLYENLDDKLLFGGGGGNQNPNFGNKFWLGAAAVAAIGEFVQWVRENKWFAGEEAVSDFVAYDGQLKVNGNEYVNVNFSKFDIESSFVASSGYRIYLLNNGIVRNSFYPIDLPAFYYLYNSSTKYYITNEYLTYWQYSDGDTIYWFSSSVLSESLSYWGYTFDDIKCATIGAVGSKCYWAIVLNDGRAIRFDNLSEYIYPQAVSLGSNISSPTEVTEFDVQEGQALELDFSIFENEAQFQSPEELADAIKNNIIDTGTVPNVSPSVVVDPSTLPQPTPVPSPVVPPPENPTYDDIDGLGLPSLGDALSDKFPFCLPSDIGRLIDIFKVQRQTPVWEVDLYEMLGDRITFAGDTALSIDLTEYEELGAISRWVTTIGFCLFLLLITRQMITW